MRKWIICLILLVYGLTMSAQTENSVDKHTIVSTVVNEEQVAPNNQQVISNLFRDNWFILGDAGVNAFWGDYSVKNF